MNKTNYPGSFQIPAMRYQSMPSQTIVDKVMTSKEWCMQEKKDGSWYMLEKIDNDTIYLFGRTRSKVTGELTEKGANVPHIIEWAKNYLPDGTILIGEIYIPGGHSNDVTKIMGCLPNKAIERQKKDGKVKYYVFDCIRAFNKDLCDEPLEVRVGYYLYYMLLECFGNYDIRGLEYHSCCDEVELAETYILDKNTSNLQLLQSYDGEQWQPHETFQIKLNEIFAAGGEGAVFKPLNSIYYPDKRPAISKGGCFKMKEHVDSIDLVCTGLLEPEMEYTGKELKSWPYWACKSPLGDEWIPYNSSKIRMEITTKDNFKPVTKPYYYGWKNALRLGVYDKDGNLIDMGRVASGLNDVLREDMAKNPDKYIGKVVECSCMSIDKEEHSLRHPVFIRFRDDKNEKECLFDEL